VGRTAWSAADDHVGGLKRPFQCESLASID
jgi:hypothetical protein